MTELLKNEENVEMLYQGDKKVGFFDENGDLYVIEEATKQSRSKLIAQKPRNGNYTDQSNAKNV